MPIQILKPNPIKFNEQVFDISFHPNQNVIATGLITGEIFCHRYSCDSNQENEKLLSLRAHRKPCRGLIFNHDGSNKSLKKISLESSSVIVEKSKAHDNPINCIKLLNENLLVTGDDDGIIKLWDLRSESNVMEYSEHEDFISDLDFSSDSRTLISVRRPNLVAMSDEQDDELLSIAIVKDGRKVVVGSQEGVINLFTWGDWGDINDRFLGHPSSIDSIVKINEETLCTGSSDGIIRVIGILPNKFHGVIGTHDEFPIECIRLSHDQTFLASCSHDNFVKFWDMDLDDSHNKNSKNDGKSKNVDFNQSNGFFADL
ncbi:20048_t:CDS:2 [Entrophospora sp. SA101]|nr:2664_t:CDS:2 [Entrophospora sp. SA101]CAJ0767014.1 20048_t:CDS:2 [Entrophospora sp. SA101]